MSPEEFRALGHRVVDWLADYRAGVAARPVSHRARPGALLEQLPSAPPEAPEGFEAVLEDLESLLLPNLVHWQHPDFFAYFPSNGDLSAVLGGDGVDVSEHRVEALRLARRRRRQTTQQRARFGVARDGSRRDARAVIGDPVDDLVCDPPEVLWRHREHIFCVVLFHGLRAVRAPGARRCAVDETGASGTSTSTRSQQLAVCCAVLLASASVSRAAARVTHCPASVWSHVHT